MHNNLASKLRFEFNDEICAESKRKKSQREEFGGTN